jgi:hypothetical protein
VFTILDFLVIHDVKFTAVVILYRSLRSWRILLSICDTARGIPAGTRNWELLTKILFNCLYPVVCTMFIYVAVNRSDVVGPRFRRTYGPRRVRLDHQYIACFVFEFERSFSQETFFQLLLAEFNMVLCSSVWTVKLWVIAPQGYVQGSLQTCQFNKAERL